MSSEQRVGLGEGAQKQITAPMRPHQGSPGLVHLKNLLWVPLLAPTAGRTQDTGDGELGEGVKKGGDPP